MSEMILYGEPGWGSMLVEAQLDWYGLPYRYESVGNLFASAEARVALAQVNPVAQVPTLVLTDGQVMTESAAITLYLADLTRDDSLVPGPDAPQRAAFLRWMVFIVANIYPTFTYGDDPSRFVALEAARTGFRSATDTYAERLYTLLDAAAGTPWFLGERFSALDIYIAGMTHWRPRRPWFAAHCPRLAAIAGAADALPRLASCWKRNAEIAQSS